MTFDFYNKYQRLSDQELLHIVRNAAQYQETAATAAQTILQERGVDIAAALQEPVTEDTPDAEAEPEDLATLLAPGYRSDKYAFRSLYEAFSTIKDNRPLLLFKIVLAIYILTYAYHIGSLFFSGNLTYLLFYSLYDIGLLALQVLLPLLLMLFLNRLHPAAWVILYVSTAYSGSVQLLSLMQLGIMGFSGDVGTMMFLTWLWLSTNIFSLYAMSLPYNRQLFRASKRTMLITLLVGLLCGIISTVINYYTYASYMETFPAY